jgi:hypothetical protein
MGLGKLMINMLLEKFGSMWISFKVIWEMNAFPHDEGLEVGCGTKVSTY